MADAANSTIARKLEVAANVCIVIVALVAVGLVARNYWLKRSEPKPVAAGEHFALKNVNWQESGNTVVFGISTTCHFCTESAPFYRELVQKCAAQRVRTIAVLPQPVDVSKAYLANEGVVVNEIRQEALPDLKIRGTPTLVLIDSKGIVKGVWIGKLSPDAEKELLAKVGA
jgi:hypothetical protein